MADEENGGTNIGAWVGGAIGIFILVVLLLWLLRWCLQGRKFTKDVRIDGKVVIITGSNTGIGKETALDMAGRGAKIYMACRDMKKCEEARLDIVAKTGNNNLFSRKLDLGSQESIRDFVRDFLKEESRLDILINNAGIMYTPRWETKEGIEMQFGVNHIGHFLLTNLLLDALKASEPSRIVIVASIGHTFTNGLNKDDINSEKSYNKYGAYHQSKLANVLMCRELSKRLQGTGVTVNCVHPGFVKTDLNRSQPILDTLMYPMYFFFKSAKAGAQTTLTVALDPDLEKVSGKYFDNCRVKTESRAAQNDESAKWLWNVSEELTKLRV